MENNTDRNSYSDIVLSRTILIIIGTVIGVIGNSAIIFFYFFRIKRGERYFIPLLGIVDLLACLTSIRYLIFDYVNIDQNTVYCKVFSFLRVCIGGISAHTILVISIQRYYVVCKPFEPKMTRSWKRVLFGVVCLISIVYSAPLLATAGPFPVNITYTNHSLTTKVCEFSDKQSTSGLLYPYLLSLIIALNLFMTICMYVPVVKQVENLFSSRTVTNSKPTYETETSHVSCKLNMEIDETGIPSNSNKQQGSSITVRIPNAHKNVMLEASDVSDDQADTIEVQKDVEDRMRNNVADTVTGNQKAAKNNKKPRSKVTPGQKRITKMFFYLIVAYVLSYTPPLIIWIIYFTVDDIYSSFTKTEITGLFLLGQLIPLNHVVNPLIYGYFDTEFKEELRKFVSKTKEQIAIPRKFHIKSPF
uniref:G-protein coupled receptors family 1 profile domain-containing protein n=1 Tax=Magallana gigas TaxID=29159 RepID=A0A8W8M3N9_MAGGI